MTSEPDNNPNILRIASLRFKTIVAEANQELTLKLTTDANIQGVIVLLQPSLPSIR